MHFKHENDRMPSAKPLLAELHSLPVEPRITYKLAFLSFKTQRSDVNDGVSNSMHRGAHVAHGRSARHPSR